MLNKLFQIVIIFQDLGLLEKKVQTLVAKYPGFHLTRGKKVIEIRPSIKWNKGDALLYLLETLGFADSSDVLPIYIGDDKTDEDAFKVRVSYCLNNCCLHLFKCFVI